jgi:predicted acyl esterase
VCDDSAPSQRITATTPEGLSAGSLGVTYAGGTTLTNASGSGDPDGLATDAIAGGAFDDATGNTGPCAASSAATWPGRYTGVSDALASERTYVGPGTVKVPYTLTGAVAELNARVWDVPPGDGKPLLITRGTYRFDTATANDPDAPAGTVTLPLYGNHWRLAPGHRLRLDLAEVDEPTFRRTDTPNTLTLGDPVLTLPTRSAGDVRLAGTGG